MPSRLESSATLLMALLPRELGFEAAVSGYSPMRRGATWRKKRRMMGRQPQIMTRLASTQLGENLLASSAFKCSAREAYIQIAGVLIAQVVSVALTMGGRRERRTRLVTKVLEEITISILIANILPGSTHKLPIPKIQANPTFCTSGTLSCQIIGSGSTKRMTSVPAFNPAVARYIFPLLTQ